MMLEWLGLRKKSATPAAAVTEAIERRDELFVEAEAAMREVDRVQRNILKDYEDAERERLGRA